MTKKTITLGPVPAFFLFLIPWAVGVGTLVTWLVRGAVG